MPGSPMRRRCSRLTFSMCGAAQRLAVLKKGGYFGERSLLISERRNATVRCLKKAELGRISRPLFTQLLDECCVGLGVVDGLSGWWCLLATPIGYPSRWNLSILTALADTGFRRRFGGAARKKRQMVAKKKALAERRAKRKDELARKQKQVGHASKS